jgi:tRNA(fMet)-specific endonuclease VapC
MILDTNALSAFADGVPHVVWQIARADELHLPVIVLGQYRFGVATSRRRREYEAWLARGRAVWNLLPVIEETASHYASIRRQLKKAGAPLPANDVWVAALARQHDLAVLSQDSHFQQSAALQLNEIAQYPDRIPNQFPRADPQERDLKARPRSPRRPTLRLEWFCLEQIKQNKTNATKSRFREKDFYGRKQRFCLTQSESFVVFVPFC